MLKKCVYDLNSLNGCVMHLFHQMLQSHCLVKVTMSSILNTSRKVLLIYLHTKFFRWWIHRNFAKHKGIGLVSLQLLCRELVKRRVEAGEVKFL